MSAARLSSSWSGCWNGPTVFPVTRIATLLEELVATEDLVIEAAEDVARAAFDYRAARAGFSDLMILAAAERSGALPLYTFDQKAARLKGVSLL